MTERRGPLRVLAVIASSDVGGAERVFASLLKALDRDRFEVWVACHGQGPMFDECSQLAVGVRSFDLLDVFDPRSVVALARYMREVRCQIVHTHLWTADVLGGLAALVARVPIRLATVHGGYFQRVEEQGLRRLRKGALSRTYRSVYRLFDRVVAVSRAVGDDLARRPGIAVDPAKITVIHNGVDLARVRPPEANGRKRPGLLPGAPLIVTAANFFAIKGHRWLVEAVPRVLRQYPDAVFVLAGDGDTLPAVRRLVEERGLAAHVRFVGSRPDALELIARSDVVVIPSVSEGLPMVVLEALALEKPVVATRVGGIPEIVEDGESGLLVPPKEPGPLADAILSVLSDPALAKRLGRQGREAVLARFSHEVMAREVGDLYLQLAARRTNAELGWNAS